MVQFEGGVNIAMKIPEDRYEATLHFYRDVLLLPAEERPIEHPTVLRTCKVQFGTNTLWLDCVRDITATALWLELKTGQLDGATQYLEANGTSTCDELEQIPEGMHWITDPAGTVILLTEDRNCP